MSWLLKGNAHTDPNEHFVGTKDEQPLVLRTNEVEAVRVDVKGNVGVGTATPQNKLHVGDGTSAITPNRVNVVVASKMVDAGVAIAQNNGVNVLVQASGAGGFIGTTSNHPLILRTNDVDRVVVRTNGDIQVGPGTTTIAASRVNAVFATTEVDAGIAIAQNSGVNVLVQASGAGGFIGTTSNHPLVFRTNDQDRVSIDTAGNLRVTGDVILTNADCAEDFDVAETAVADPGTVMVLGEAGRLEHSQRAYDKRVAGVISGAGDYRPAIVLDRQPPASDRKAIALVGKVYCKVDASDAPIEVGDLLTTSATPGHAMKASDPSRAFGAVIGKALRPLDGGLGLIPVLIALQ
jgi:hypothetical protein